MKLIEKTCVVCGETFLAGKSQARYCSNRCAKKAAREREKQRKIVVVDGVKLKVYTKVCQCCGETFTSNAYQVQYCSDKCRKIMLNKGKELEQINTEYVRIRKPSTLIPLSVEARKQGISYGKLQAMRYLEGQK